MLAGNKILLGLLFFCSASAFAQESLPRILIGLELSNGIPVGSFRQQLEDVDAALGFGFEAHYRLNASGPWFLGIDAGTVRYEKIRNLMWIDGERFPVKTTFHFTTVGATATYMPRMDKVQPFITVMAGVAVLYTATKSDKSFFELLFNNFENELIYDKNHVTPALGIVPGIQLGKGPVRFRASCKFMFAGKVNHVDPSSLEVDDINEITYNYRTTYPRMVIPEVGISVLIGSLE